MWLIGFLFSVLAPLKGRSNKKKKKRTKQVMDRVCLHGQTGPRRAHQAKGPRRATSRRARTRKPPAVPPRLIRTAPIRLSTLPHCHIPNDKRKPRRRRTARCQVPAVGKRPPAMSSAAVSANVAVIGGGSKHLDRLRTPERPPVRTDACDPAVPLFPRPQLRAP